MKLVSAQTALEHLLSENAKLEVQITTLQSQNNSLTAQHTALQLANSQLVAEKEEVRIYNMPFFPSVNTIRRNTFTHLIPFVVNP